MFQEKEKAEVSNNSLKKESNNFLIDKINKIFAVFIVIWVCWPWFGQNAGLLGASFFAGVWCITAWLSKTGYSLKVGDLMLILYGSIMALSYIFFGKVYAEFELLYYIPMLLLFFLPYYMFRFYNSKENRKFLGQLAVVGIVFMIVGAVTSSYYTFLNPRIMKTISQATDKEYVEYRKVGIGSFGFVYMLMFVIVAIIGEFKKKTEAGKLTKLLMVLFCIAAVKCIIDSTFTTALLLSLIGSLLVLISSKKSPQLNVFIYFVVLLSFVVLSQAIGNFLINISLESPDVTMRLREIGSLLLGDDGGDNTESRMRAFQISWTCFFEYPLLGFNFVQDPEYRVGGHSEWIDIFAVYGLLGGIPVIGTLVAKIADISKKSKLDNSCPHFGIIIFMFFIYGIIDPFLRIYNIGFALFLLVPAVGYISEAFKKEDNKQ